ncbi:MAG: tyrosine-type recombinase/integrase [Desulfovibrio sp.]|uniref:tyrosine-type recombinase/integrase n=1 Tax=Desulfovibrio sp. TaxID=885 RepID=UPI00135DC86A|nr:tyrosine-type recombinase/integrase [Desulfovibrio sp.]MTJ93926.1 tyrosine-type recombinase/integrase [Desulfovibrio sp.]
MAEILTVLDEDTACPFTIHTQLFGPLVRSAPPSRQRELQALASDAAVYATRAKGEGTVRAYRSAWRQYEAWCSSLGFPPLNGEAEVIGLYIVKAAERLTVATLRVHLAAIATAHRLAGIPIDLKHPRIALVLEGVSRTKGRRPRRQAVPLLPDILQRMLAAQPDTPLGLRNRAMLLIGFGGALRRSELVGLDLGDVREVPQRGLSLFIQRSKTDQHGDGEEVGIWSAADPESCALVAWRRWLAVRGEVGDDQPLFCGVLKNGALTGRRLSAKAVERLLRDTATGLGLLDAARYTGHSLRAGLATAAADEDAQLHDIMRQTRHKSADVARRYIRSRYLWKNNVTERVFRKG